MSSLRFLSSASPVKLMKILNSTPTRPLVANFYNRGGCGNREVVGYGLNGRLMYGDTTLNPYPAIRFRENTPELLALREKERGDWRLLSVDEKKFLYRASFCQTFAEIEAPTGEWKSILAYTIIGFSASLWIWIYMHIFGNVCSNIVDLPVTSRAPVCPPSPAITGSIVRTYRDLNVNKRHLFSSDCCFLTGEGNFATLADTPTGFRMFCLAFTVFAVTLSSLADLLLAVTYISWSRTRACVTIKRAAGARFSPLPTLQVRNGT